VDYYARYRLPFPDPLIRRVAALAGLQPGDAVLDLGTGPGTLAVPFARLGLGVTAMDPEPDMLAAAKAAAQEAGVTLNLRPGSSYDLTPQMGPFKLVTIGRAFHWMDRAATLEMLDRIVAPDGGIAFFHDAHPPLPENGWFKTLVNVADKYGRAAAAHVRERREGGHRRYESYLFASAFTRLEGLSMTIRHPLTEDAIVGRAYSMSPTAPEKLGALKEVFERDLRAALRETAPDGSFIEIAELVALLARRP
jgi:ubiquinone/menaquinone biosynthesis C-methylase UbiE